MLQCCVNYDIYVINIGRYLYDLEIKKFLKGFFDATNACVGVYHPTAIIVPTHFLIL